VAVAVLNLQGLVFMANIDSPFRVADEVLPGLQKQARVIFVDSYPTTATGKIRRVELRAQAAGVLQ